MLIAYADALDEVATDAGLARRGADGEVARRARRIRDSARNLAVMIRVQVSLYC